MVWTGAGRQGVQGRNVENVADAEKLARGIRMIKSKPLLIMSGINSDLRPN
jgi:hypothetical protein